MIGPHQGKELELMLAGRKHLAIFCEAIVEGKYIPEEIIPEKAFAPYVAKGALCRFSRDFLSPKLPYPARYVCFTTPRNEWRAEAFLEMHNECISGKRPFDDAHEFFVGRLLGYEDADIQHFINHFKEARKKKSPLARG